MLHRLKQIDGAFWEVDNYTIQLEELLDGSAFYSGFTLAGEQVTDAHTKFEDCLGELITLIESEREQ
jgi:hypothetical protein